MFIKTISVELSLKAMFYIKKKKPNVSLSLFILTRIPHKTCIRMTENFSYLTFATHNKNPRQHNNAPITAPRYIYFFRIKAIAGAQQQKIWLWTHDAARTP